MPEDTANNSTAPESVATPVSAEPAVETTAQPPARPESAWDFSNVKDEPAPDASKPAKADEPAKTETPAKAEPDKQEESSEEDQILAEVFGEKKPDEEAAKEKPDSEEAIDKQNPEEMKKAQANATAKSYLERAEKVYTPAKEFKYGSISADEFAEKLTGFIGKEKAQEFSQTQAHKLVDENPDIAFHRIYAVKMLAKDPSYKYDPSNVPSLDELLSGATAPAASDNAAKTADAPAGELPAELTAITKELDGEIGFDWRDPANDHMFLDDREKMMAGTIRELEKKAIAEAQSKKELTEKLGKLEKSVETITTNNQTEEQKAVRRDVETNINTFRSSIETKILPYIQKNTGLEVSKDDTPEVAAFKERKMTLYTGDEFQRSQGVPSRFETFAYYESSVKQDLTNLANQVATAQLKAVIAKRQGNEAEATRLAGEVEELRIPTIQLLAKANGEFKAKYIDPDIKLLGMKSAKVAEPILEAAERIETVGQGSTHSKPARREYKTADDVWGGMVEESAEEERLRSAA
jgi:hypothetical protein